MDLGRFSEAVATDGGGERPGDGGVVNDGGPFFCLTFPAATLDTTPITVQVLVTNSTAGSATAAQIDGGSALIDVEYTPVPGVTVAACNPLDALCDNPAAQAQTTDDAGLVTFPQLSGAFTGFYHFTNPDIVPSSFFPGQMLSGIKTVELFTAALTYEDEQALNSAIDNAVILDASAGYGEVFMSVYDCYDHSVAGVTFSFSGTAGPQQLPFYLASGIPNTTNPVTDSEGVGGAVNVPKGSVKVTATYVATEQTLGSLDVFVNPGELTVGYVRMRALHAQP